MIDLFLNKKKCKPCTGTTEKFTKNKIEEYLRQIDSWAMNNKQEMIFKKFKFKNFRLTMEFINKQDSTKVIQGEFSLKNLSYFIKCTNLCNSIEMFLENDLPLVVKYSVASLGEIKLCLAPLPSN